MLGKLPAGSVEATRSFAAYDKGRQAADEHGALGVQAKAVFTPNVPGRWRFALVSKVGKVKGAYPVAQSALLLEGDKGWEAAVVLGGGELPAPKDSPAQRTVVAVGSVEVTEHDAKYGRKAILLTAGLEDRGKGPAYAQETELWVRGPGEHKFRPTTAADIRWEKDRW